MIEFAIERRIDTVWTVVFERIGGGAKILAFAPDISVGYDREHELQKIHLLETSKRCVFAISLGDPEEQWLHVEVERLTVVNQQNVFSYGTWEGDETGQQKERER